VVTDQRPEVSPQRPLPAVGLFTPTYHNKNRPGEKPDREPLHLNSFPETAASSRLELDDDGAGLSGAIDVLDRFGELIECVGAGDVEFFESCGDDCDNAGDVGGAAFGCDATEPTADRQSADADFAAD
jgi:hypothetical protein